jgi:hypothetical protein
MTRIGGSRDNVSFLIARLFVLQFGQYLQDALV